MGLAAFGRFCFKTSLLNDADALSRNSTIAGPRRSIFTTKSFTQSERKVKAARKMKKTELDRRLNRLHYHWLTEGRFCDDVRLMGGTFS